MGSQVRAIAERASQKLPAAESRYEPLQYQAKQVGLDYDSSVYGGWILLRSKIRQMIANCPGTRIGLIGWSQGGHVINQTLRMLSTAELTYVRAVTLIADPLSDPTGSYHLDHDIYGNKPRATQGGILGRQRLPSAVHARTQDWCIVNDPVCDWATGGPGYGTAVGEPFHSAYGTCCSRFPIATAVANTFANRMLAAWTPPPTPPTPPPGGGDPPTPTSIAVKRNDYNRDNVSDLIGVRTSDGCLARWKGTGNGGFDYLGDYGCGWENYTNVTGVGDFNRDGVGDLIGIRKSDGCLARWKGTGGSGFTYIGDYGCGWGSYTNVTGAGDINRDGVGDLVGIRKSDGCIARWKGNGNGGFDYIGDYGCGWNSYTIG